MKPAYIILALFLALLSSSLLASNTSIANFGTDIIAHYDQDLHDQNSTTAVAYNGWIYMAYSTSHSGPPGTDIYFVISKDSGLTWQPFPASITGTHNGAAVYDLIVAGTDTNNLRLYLAYYNFSVAFPYSFGGVAVFDGLSGNSLPYGKTFGDGTYGIGDVHIASDWNHPAFGSNGYSVAITYSTQAGDSTSTDSLVCLISSDTSTNDFTYYLLDSSSVENIYQPTISYGHSLAWNNGRYFISYMKGTEVYTCRNISDISSGFTNSINLNILTGISGGTVGYPKIVCQNSFGDNDSSGLSVMIMTRALDTIVSGTFKIPYVIYNMQAAFSEYWFAESVFASSNDASIGTYDVAYSEEQNRFYFTAYNTDSAKLFTRIEDFNFNSGGIWFNVTDQYNDSVIDPATEPNPRISCFGQFAYTSWVMSALGAGGMPSSQIMFDRQELPLLTSTEEKNPSKNIFIYPNPFSHKVYIQNPNGIVLIEVMDISGRLVYSKTAQGNRDEMLDLSTLKNGIYLIKLTDNRGNSRIGRAVLEK